MTTLPLRRYCQGPEALKPGRWELKPIGFKVAPIVRLVPTTGDMQGTQPLLSYRRRYDLFSLSCVEEAG
jgi:hypothetical protein